MLMVHFYDNSGEVGNQDNYYHQLEELVLVTNWIDASTGSNAQQV